MCKKKKKPVHRKQTVTDIHLKHTVTVNEMMDFSGLWLFLDVLYLSRLVGGHNVSGGC